MLIQRRLRYVKTVIYHHIKSQKVSQVAENQRKDGFSASNCRESVLRTAARKNMNRVLTNEQFQLLLNRNRIENVWSVMKLNYNLIYHRARSVTGMFRHFFYSISAFLFHLVDDVKHWFLPNYSILVKLEF